MDLDAVFLHLGRLGVHELLGHLLAGGLGGQDGAAAEAAALLEDDGGEAALLHEQGGLHAGGAAADYGHGPACAVYYELVVAEAGLAAGDGVDGTVEVAAGDDALVAVHALETLADEVLAPGLGLGDEVGVGYVHAAHADEVAHALLEQLFSLLGVAQGVDADDGDLHRVLYGLDEGPAPALGRIAGLYHRGRAGIDAAADVEVIDVGLQVLGDLDAGVLVVAALDEVVAVNARADNEVRADGLADALQYAHHEAAAVLHAPAVLIRALVGVGAHELLEQVAVRAVDLDAVGAGEPGVHRGLDEEADEAVDVLDGHLAGQDGVAADDAVELDTGGHGLPAAVEGRGRLAAAVMELDEDLGAVAVYRVADVLHAPYLPGVVDTELDAVAVAAVGVHGGELGDDEPAAALGALLVETSVFRRGASVPVAQHHAHGRHDHPVAQLEPAYLSFFKQLFVFHYITSCSCLLWLRSAVGASV